MFGNWKTQNMEDKVTVTGKKTNTGMFHMKRYENNIGKMLKNIYIAY